MGSNRRMEFARWPRYEMLYRKFWQIRFDQIKARPKHSKTFDRFATSDEMFDWWLSDNPSPNDGTCQQGLW